MMCSVLIHLSMHGMVHSDVVPLRGPLHTRKVLSMAVSSGACRVNLTYSEMPYNSKDGNANVH